MITSMESMGFSRIFYNEKGKLNEENSYSKEEMGNVKKCNKEIIHAECIYGL